MLPRRPPESCRRRRPSTADGFATLELDDRLLSAIAALGYEEPTPIQREAIPPLLAGRDLLGRGPDRHGQDGRVRPADAPAHPARRRPPTAAPPPSSSSRPASWRCRSPRPSTKYGRGLGARVLPVYGGQPIGQQLRGLRRGVDVVVATPGRAVDHLKRGSLRFDAVERGHPRRGRRDARHGLRRGPRGDPVGDAGRTPDGALLGHDLGRPSRAIAKRHLRDPARIKVHAEKAVGRRCSARPADRLRRAPRPTSWPRCAASSTSKTRPRPSSSAGRAARSTTSPRR